jgi:glycosyltransferase involved in cell wall biosynthesis
MSVYHGDKLEYFKSAFLSVVNQTLKPDEIVVIKDGPVDSEIDHFLSNIDIAPIFIKVKQLNRNYGLGIALAKGVKFCSHEIIARMDSDDISLPDRFYKQIRFFENNPKLSIIGGQIEEFFEKESRIVGVRRVPTSYKKILSFMKYRSPFNHVTVMFRKSSVIKVGNYQDFKLNEDYHLWVRLLSNRFFALNLEDILVRVRMNPSSFKRKGGMSLFLKQLRIQKYLLNNGLTNIFLYSYNFLVRFLVQVIMPNSLRTYFYYLLLRNKPK